MARKRRPHFSGTSHLVIVRGNERQGVFRVIEGGQGIAEMKKGMKEHDGVPERLMGLEKNQVEGRKRKIMK